MRKITIIFMLGILFIFPLQARKLKVRELPSRYKKWLEEEVVYIITRIERDVFLQLKSEREREMFIDAFWKQRDPTPGTPENEFKVEHYQRIIYANKIFGRETYRPGWVTDRGEIYIVLGEPLSIDRFEGINGIHPIRIWSYQGYPKYDGLPGYFNIVFFKRDGMGEFVLYSPSGDGPHSLLSYLRSQIDSIDIEAAYEALFELEPAVAANSLTLIPGEQLYPGQVSLSSDIMLNAVQELPQKKIKPGYAEALLRYKDIVEVEYSANYVECDSLIRIVKDDEGIFFVHYSLEPKKLSVGTYENKYYTNFKINGNVQDLEGRVIFQYEKSIPLEFSKDQINNMGHQAFALQDMFPLIEGHYKFSLLLKNTVAKEFSSFEEDIFIPPSSSSIQMNRLILGYRVEKLSVVYTLKPFQVGNNQIWVQPQKIFLPKEKLYVYFQIFGLTEELRKNGAVKYTFYKGEEEMSSRIKDINEYPDGVNFLEEFDLEKFSPGYYEMRVALLDRTKNEAVYEKENFQISPLPALPRPLVVSKSILLSKKVVYFHMLGIQWLNKGELNKARFNLERAYRQNLEEVRFALDLSRSLYLLKEFNQAKEILLKFYSEETKNYAVLELLARSFQALGKFKEAVGYYKEHLSHFGTKLEILNSIGECYFNLGELEEALYAWEKSLEINPKQENIKRRIKVLKDKIS